MWIFVTVHLPCLNNPNQFVSVDNSVQLHYFSKREGLQDFVRGLLQGLGKLYKTSVIIELINSRDHGDDHEIFKVSW